MGNRSARACMVLAIFAFVLPATGLFAQGTTQPPSQAQARRAVRAEDLPLTITAGGSYYLADNVTVSAWNVNGITIAADNVTLDLEGHTLKGPGQGSGTSGSGISIRGVRRNIRVKNGGLTGWFDNGIELYKDQSNRATMCQVSEITAYRNGNVGIYAGNLAEVFNCNGSEGNRVGIQMIDGIIRNCVASNNLETGIAVNPPMVRSEPSSVFDCMASYNSKQGIWVWSFATVDRNSCSWNGTFNKPEACGIYAYGNYNTIRQNHLGFNALGILIRSTAMQNTVYLNTSMHPETRRGFQIDASRNTVGTIYKTPMPLSSVDPYPNFSSTGN